MTALLDVSDISIRFGGIVAADGVNLCVNAGENLAIIGPNGAGKTTFLNICTGYLTPVSGTVRFEGCNITRMPPRKITNLGIARAFQIPQLFLEQTVLENMLLAIAARNGGWFTARPLGSSAAKDEAHDLLKLLKVEGFSGRVANELPEGTRKLIDIAIALALRPRLLLMDEPTSGVASVEKFTVMDVLVAALSARSVSSIFVEHDMEMVTRYANRVAVWNGGRIQKEGSPADILADADVRRQVIGA
ncbi:MAG: ATP-binding cassette domain-containing protein [Pseudomonadota bacterium]